MKRRGRAAHTPKFDTKKFVFSFPLVTAIMVSAAVSLAWFAVTAIRSLKIDWLVYYLDLLFPW